MDNIEEDDDEEEVIAAVDRSAREVVSADDVLILRRIIYRLLFILCLQFISRDTMYASRQKNNMSVCGVHDQMNSFASFPPSTTALLMPAASCSAHHC